MASPDIIWHLLGDGTNNMFTNKNNVNFKSTVEENKNL